MIIFEDAYKAEDAHVFVRGSFQEAKRNASFVTYVNQALVLTPREASASIPTQFKGGFRADAIQALRGFAHDSNHIFNRDCPPIGILLIEEVNDPRLVDDRLTIEQRDERFLRVVKKPTPRVPICTDVIDDYPYADWEIYYYNVDDPDDGSIYKRYAFLLCVDDEGYARLVIWDTDVSNRPVPINI